MCIIINACIFTMSRSSGRTSSDTKERVVCGRIRRAGWQCEVNSIPTEELHSSWRAFKEGTFKEGCLLSSSWGLGFHWTDYTDRVAYYSLFLSVSNSNSARNMWSIKTLETKGKPDYIEIEQLTSSVQLFQGHIIQIQIKKIIWTFAIHVYRINKCISE